MAAGLLARNRWRLSVLLAGILFAAGRSTAASWLRAVGGSDDCQDYFCILAPPPTQGRFGRQASRHSRATTQLPCSMRTTPHPSMLGGEIEIGGQILDRPRQ